MSWCRLALFAIACLVCLYQPHVMAQLSQITLGNSSGAGDVSVIRAQPLRISEIVPSSEVGQTGAAVNAQALGGVLVADGVLPRALQLPDFIERSVLVRWKVPIDDAFEPERQTLEAEWVCSSGEAGVARVDGQRVATGVRVDVDRPRRQSSDSLSVTWETTVRIRFPVEALERAGNLEGCLVLERTSD